MKSFNVLLDAPPSSCEINGQEYPINTDFRVVLGYLRMLKKEDLDEEEKIRWGLQLFFGKKDENGVPVCRVKPSDIQELYEYIKWYVRCGEEIEEEGQGKKEDPVFDLFEDAGRIYSAFMQTYRINLRKERIHWWVFSELLEGLPKGTHLADVIELRGRKSEDWMSAEVKADLTRAKLMYRIGKDKPLDADFSGVSALWG